MPSFDGRQTSGRDAQSEKNGQGINPSSRVHSFSLWLHSIHLTAQRDTVDGRSPAPPKNQSGAGFRPSTVGVCLGA